MEPTSWSRCPLFTLQAFVPNVVSHDELEIFKTHIIYLFSLFWQHEQCRDQHMPGPQAPLWPSNWSALYRGRGSPVMSWIIFKANNGQQASGVGDKRFFRFKRNVQHLWTAIIRHHVNDTKYQQVMRFNQWSKFANIFKVHWKIFSASGHSRSPITSCRTRPPGHNQWILTGPARVKWLWVNDFSHNEYHIWQAWPSTCWQVGNKLPKYEVPVFIAQTRNHWRKWKGCASVPKNGLPNGCD